MTDQRWDDHDEFDDGRFGDKDPDDAVDAEDEDRERERLRREIEGD